MRGPAACGFGLIVVLLASPAEAQSQPPLGEVARKEAERRARIEAERSKSKPAGAKTYTNEDLRKGPPLTTSAPAAKSQTPAPARGAQDANKPAGADSGRDEKYWRDRITAARAALERHQIFLDALQSRINALTADFTARDDPAQRALIGIERQRALAELDKVKAEIQQMTQQIADIEEEARRAGVPPGWLR